ncbi:MAG: YIP1 family protein [bacterium]|nr:YIP1 family protein [bacterium]MDD5353923.1 YIP1 family protein [bacterium]MDD5755766.1 YIP1 family protein [bacterium]
MERLGIISKIITDPEQGFNDLLLYKKPLWFSFLMVVISLFCQSVAVLLIDNYGSVQVTSMLTVGYLAKLFAFVVFWILMTSLFHFIASWHKTEGSINHLFILFGATLLPLIFLPAGAILSRGLGAGSHFLYLFIYLLIIIWILSLQVKSLKIIYHLQTGKAISVYVIPFISTFFLLIISLAMFIILTVILIGKSF